MDQIYNMKFGIALTLTMTIRIAQFLNIKRNNTHVVRPRKEEARTYVVLYFNLNFTKGNR